MGLGGPFPARSARMWTRRRHWIVWRLFFSEEEGSEWKGEGEWKCWNGSDEKGDVRAEGREMDAKVTFHLLR